MKLRSDVQPMTAAAAGCRRTRTAPSGRTHARQCRRPPGRPALHQPHPVSPFSAPCSATTMLSVPFQWPFQCSPCTECLLRS